MNEREKLEILQQVSENTGTVGKQILAKLDRIALHTEQTALLLERLCELAELERER